MTNTQAPKEPVNTPADQNRPLTEKDWDRTSPIETTYDVKSKGRDPRWGSGSYLVHPKTGVELFARERNTNNQTEAETYIREAQKRKNVHAIGLATLHDYSVKIVSSFCSKNFRITEYWDASTHDLEQAVKKRLDKNSNFNDKELTYMLYNTTHGLAALNDNSLNHGDISPLYIDIGKDGSDQDYRLVDPANRQAKIAQTTYNNLS